MFGPATHNEKFAGRNPPAEADMPAFLPDEFACPGHLHAAIRLTDRMLKRGIDGRVVREGVARRLCYAGQAVRDQEGNVCFDARSSAMIVSAGYVSSGPEAAAVFYANPGVQESDVPRHGVWSGIAETRTKTESHRIQRLQL